LWPTSGMRLRLACIGTATLTGGASAFSFAAAGWSGYGPPLRAALPISVVANNDVNFTLSDTSLGRSGLPTLTLANMEAANLTGGTSANTFTVGGWTGSGTITGGGGTDVIAATKDANFTLTDASLSTSDG